MNEVDDLTARDLIALIAMHAAVSRTDAAPKYFADEAYAIADAMLAKAQA